MHDIAEFLKGHDPFSGLDEGALERLAERAEVEFFAPGTVLVGGPNAGRRLIANTIPATRR